MSSDTTVSPAPDRPGVAAATPAEQRLMWLFRDSLRRQQIHPLLAVMRRYRERAPK
jgi:hypothetical protein